MRRIYVMARVTFYEASRKRILWMALAAALGFLALFGTGLHFQKAAMEHRALPPMLRNQAYIGMLLVGAYAIDMLVVAMTILTSVDTLAGEIASGSVQAIATRPISRTELVLGKWLGFTGILAAYIVLTMGGINVLSFIMTGTTLRHLGKGLALIGLEAELLLSVSLFFGTKVSTITNGVIVLSLHGLAFVAAWIEQAGALTKTPAAVQLGVLVSVLMPSESLWRRAINEMQPAVATAIGASPFSSASVPSNWMLLYAAFYTLAFLALAARSMTRRDL